MGIVNRDGALYMATGFDNTGMYAGRREAMGIIKAMASQITSFDVFSGIGISAATAFASAAKDSYDFEKEFRKNMLEVATISTQVEGSMTDFMNQVMEITQQVPIKAPEAAKALYQIVSAGHDGAAGMKILEVSAKAAVGGLTDTTTAADAITTVLNAYKMSADEASNISDQLFTTVRLGKTTFGELGQSIAQVAPIAASYGVEIDQVLAAVASLTKQGTPTAQAMTQIRAAIIGTSKELGDGAFETRTFQEALAEVATRANGSESKLRELVPEIEAVNGVLGMTGKNAKAAAFDLGELQNAAGASEAAFGKMKDEVGNQMILLSNNIQAALRPMGQAILKEVSDVARAFNEAFANDDIQNSVKYLGDLIVVLSGAVIGYKGAILASTAVQRINIAVLRQAVLERNMEKVALLNGVVGHHALSAAQLKEIATKKILISAIKVHTVAMLKNISAMAANPYVLAAAAIAALGFVVYKSATQINEADKAQKRLNDSIKESEKAALSEQRELAKLKGELSALSKGSDEYNIVKDKIIKSFGKYYSGLDTEIEKVGLTEQAYTKLTEAINKSFGARQYEKFVSEQQEELSNTMSDNLEKIQDELLKKLGNETGSKIFAKIRDGVVKGTLSTGGGSYLDIKGLDNETKSALDKISGVADNDWIRNKAIEGYIRNIILANKATDELVKKAKERFGIENDVKTDASEETAKAEQKSSSDNKKENQADKLREQQEKLALLMDKQGREQIRSTEDLWNEVWQAQIDSMDEGSEKTLTQMELNHEKELQAIDRQKEDLLQKKKDQAEAVFNQKEDEKKTRNPNHVKQTFDGSGITLDDTENAQFDEKYKAALDKQARERQAYFDAEKQAMNEYLVAYGNYQEKRKAITEKYNDLIAKATTEGEKLSLGKEWEKAISDLDIEANKSTSAISALFDDMSKKTVDDLHAIANAGEEALQFLQNGQWDATTGARLGISEETFKTLMDSPKELEVITKAIIKMREEANQCDNAFGQISGGLKKMFSAGSDTKKFQEGLAEVSEGMNKVMQAGQFLSDSLTELGDAFGNDTLTGIAEGVNVAMDAMGSAMDGAKAGAAFGPWGAAAGAAIGMVTSLASSFAKIHDAKNEKRIERLQDQIETLDKSYEMLGTSIEKAYSKDASKLIDQQNKLLEQQKVLINQQIAEEEEKKKTDDDRINEWREQLEEIDKTLANNKEKAKDAIFGEDLQSAIDNFAQAYADAWSKGENRSKSAKDTVKNMMRQMVVESIKAAMESSKAMEKIRAKLEEFYADNVLTGWEQDYIYNMAEGLQKELDEQFGWADSLMKDDEEKKKEGVSGQLQAAMTEGTASQLVGLWNSTAIDMRELKNIGIEQRDSVKSIMSDVREIIRQNFLIEQHTRRGADNTDGLIDELRIGFSDVSKRLGTIEKNTKTSNSRG